MTRTSRRNRSKNADPKKRAPEVIDYSSLVEPPARNGALAFHLEGHEAEPPGGEEPTAASETQDPGAEDLLVNAARKAGARGEVTRAVALYREVLEHQPGRTDVRFALALVLKLHGDAASALEELDRCVAEARDNPAFRTARGAVFTSMGRFPEALGDLQRSLEMDPASVDTHFHFGVLMARKGLWADAVPFLRRSIELDPGGAAAYLHLGDALNHADDLSGALQAYQRCAELGPTNPRALYGLGVVYDRLNQPDEAAAMYRRSREIAGT